MSWLETLGGNLRKIILLEDKIDRLLDDVQDMGRAIGDHEKRLVRIETMIEMTRGAAGVPKLPEG